MEKIEQGDRQKLPAKVHSKNVTKHGKDCERHHNATSNGCPEHTNHEEEDGTPTARTPTATFHKTVSCSVIRKHKGRSKQNATVPH